MKQEDYFKIMDCVSDEDISDLMKHRRSRYIPAEKEEIVMAQSQHTEKNEIQMTRRKAMIGSAVAAVLLAVNVGGGYLLLHTHEQTDPGSAADTDSVQLTEQLEEQSSLIEESSEDSAEVIEVKELPHYAQVLETFYKGQTDEPIDFDFTGYGTDLEETWENDEYKLTLHAAAGTDWSVFYFYDLEPKQGQKLEQHYFMSPLTLQLIPVEMPHQEWQPFITQSDLLPITPEEADPNNWRYYGMLTNTTDQPFFHADGEPVSHTFRLSVEYYAQPAEEGQPSEHHNDEIGEITLDFSAHEFPLHTLAEPKDVHDLGQNPSDFMGAMSTSGSGAAFLMTRCAETPFGIYYVSDRNQTSSASNYPDDVAAGKGLIGNPVVVRNADGEVTRALHTAYCSAYGINAAADQGIGFMYLAFDAPVDPASGTSEVLFDGTVEYRNVVTPINPDDLPKMGHECIEVYDPETGKWTEYNSAIFENYDTDDENRQERIDLLWNTWNYYLKGISLTKDGKELNGNGEVLKDLDGLQLTADWNDTGKPIAECNLFALIAVNDGWVNALRNDGSLTSGIDLMNADNQPEKVYPSPEEFEMYQTDQTTITVLIQCESNFEDGMGDYSFFRVFTFTLDPNAA